MRNADPSYDPFAGSGLPKRLRPLTPVGKARMGGASGIVRFMADTMIERRSAKGDCTDVDLRMAGLTQAEIDTHGMATRQKAMLAVREAA